MPPNIAIGIDPGFEEKLDSEEKQEEEQRREKRQGKKNGTGEEGMETPSDRPSMEVPRTVFEPQSPHPELSEAPVDSPRHPPTTATPPLSSEPTTSPPPTELAQSQATENPEDSIKLVMKALETAALVKKKKLETKFLNNLW
jgi:hypothetical protein